MRVISSALVLLAASPSLAAQEPPVGVPRLVDSIEAPYAYLHLDGESAKATPVQALLADPALDVIFAGDAAARDADGAPPGSSGSSQALKLVRGMLARGVGEVELAMTGIVGAGGNPLLVMRCRLQADTARRWRVRLEQGAEFARPSRRLGGTQTYRLAGGGLAGLGATDAGEVFELAVVDDDFVIGNDTSAMREVLEPRQETAASATRKVLSADPRYQDLRGRLDVPVGSLLAYGDWQRLGRRLQSRMAGASAQLLESSGLGHARSVMMTIAPAGDGAAGRAAGAGFTATLLLDFGGDEAASGDIDGGEAASGDIDGWFSATQPVAARNLLRELPHGGLGGLVLSVDLAAVASASPRSSHLVWDVREAFDDYGLDFDRNVLGRLGVRGTVQLHFAPLPEGADQAAGDAAAFAAVAPVYSVRAKSRKAAADLFGDLRRVAEKTDLGALVERRDGRGKRLDLIRLVGRRNDFTAFLAVHEDSLLITGDEESLVQAHEELRRSRPRGQRLAASTIQAIDGADVAGLFDVDLDPVFGRIAAAIDGVDLTSLPKRHVGYLDIDRRDGRAVVRIRVLSSR